MLAIKAAQPEINASHETWVSPAEAKRLAEIIQDALLWMKEPEPKPFA